MAIIDAETTSLKARVDTGAGVHDIAMSDTGAYAYVSNSAAGTVSVIDAARLVKKCDLAAGPAPMAVCFSAASQAAYVSTRATARFPSLRANLRRSCAESQRAGVRPPWRLHRAAGSVSSPIRGGTKWPSLTRRRTASFAASQPRPSRTRSHSRKTWRTSARRKRHRAAGAVAGAGESECADVGDRHPGGPQYTGPVRRKLLAAAIAPAVGDDAVLIANPLDQTLYYYKEGLSAPMGAFAITGTSRGPSWLLIAACALSDPVCIRRSHDFASLGDSMWRSFSTIRG